MVPLGRMADSREDIGSVVAFLASPAASYVTGVKMSAGGGIGMCIAS
jgi:NAD(P)-dependent dehydrogenase (short-subunit alcohol dehydrogenase family)